MFIWRNWERRRKLCNREKAKAAAVGKMLWALRVFSLRSRSSFLLSLKTSYNFFSTKFFSSSSCHRLSIEKASFRLRVAIALAVVGHPMNKSSIFGVQCLPSSVYQTEYYKSVHIDCRVFLLFWEDLAKLLLLGVDELWWIFTLLLSLSINIW